MPLALDYFYKINVLVYFWVVHSAKSSFANENINLEHLQIKFLLQFSFGTLTHKWNISLFQSTLLKETCVKKYS